MTMQPRRNHLRSAVPVALAVLLLLTATFAASVWHNHRGSSEATCQICHVGHQPMDQHFSSGCIEAPALIAEAPVPLAAPRFGAPAIRFTVSRAPPQA